MCEADSFAPGVSNWKANSPTYCANKLQTHELLSSILLCSGNNLITLHMWNIYWLACAIRQFQWKLLHQCRSDNGNKILQIVLTELQPKIKVLNAKSSTPDQNV